MKTARWLNSGFSMIGDHTTFHDCSACCHQVQLVHDPLQSISQHLPDRCPGCDADMTSTVPSEPSHMLEAVVA